MAVKKSTKKVAQTVITEDKFYTISAANGKIVEVADYNTDNGAKIQLWDNANAEWQQWGFVRAGEGVYRIKNRFTRQDDGSGLQRCHRRHPRAPVGGRQCQQPALDCGAAE